MMPWWLLLAGGWFAMVWVLGPLVGRFFAPVSLERLKPDPAFDPALRADEQWAGVEQEWHEFVESFGVREVQR